MPLPLYFSIKSGWRKWYRPWRNYLARFGGWIIIKRWSSAFEKDAFSKKLQKAKIGERQEGGADGGAAFSLRVSPKCLSADSKLVMISLPKFRYSILLWW